MLCNPRKKAIRIHEGGKHTQKDSLERLHNEMNGIMKDISAMVSLGFVKYESN